jgi:glycosyltransferase involved in cell wall biosynthesis
VSTPRITYDLAVHNSAAVLEATVQAVLARLGGIPGSEIVLVENGSTDTSPQLCAELATGRREGVEVVAATSATGLGHALRRGLELARGDLVVLTAADLPFGFTDLDAWLRLDNPPAVVLGSKGHPQSHVHVSASRRVLSGGFRVLRRLAVGIDAADTQGSILISGELGRRILPMLTCDDYLVETEIVAWAVRMGERPLEVPVVYERPTASTVSPISDSARMAIGLVRLRRRLRDRDGRLPRG